MDLEENKAGQINWSQIMQGLESQPEEFGPFSFCQSTFIKYLLQTRCCGRWQELKTGSNPCPLGQ